jgi:hypothetical protein
MTCKEAMAMAKFWRLQNLAEFQSQPSWDSYDMVVPYQPADEDGWEGFWWANRAEFVDYDSLRAIDELDFLVRTEDVEKARAGNSVDIFVPGLYGCERATDLVAYIDQIGGIDDDQFICLYEGHEYPEYQAFDGAVFGPVRLLAVYPAKEWLERAKRGEFDEEAEG